jgi:hypothetical protein
MISASLNLDTRSLRRPPQKDYQMYLKKDLGAKIGDNRQWQYFVA